MSKKKSIFVPEEEYKSRYADYRGDRKNEQKPENAKGTFLRFLSLIKPYAFSMFVVVSSAMLSTLCNVVAPEYMGNVINILQKQIEGRLTGGSIDFTATFDQLFVLAGLYILASLFTFIQEFVSFRKENNLTQEMLSYYSNVNRVQIARIESGMHSPTVKNLIDILGPVGYTIKIEKINRKK